MALSKRAQRTSASPLRSLVGPIDKTVHIHKLNIGQPDVHSPTEFIQAIKNFDKNVVEYDLARGNQELLSEWTKFLNKNYQLDITPEQMLITAGSSEALMFVFSICCDVNDEVLVFAPSYANYAGFAAIAGVSLVPVSCDIESGFHIPSNIESIKAKITPNTRAILICNPNNPTGTVLCENEIETLLELCESHDLFLIVDEVYREFVYETTPKSVLQISQKNPRVVVVDSVSKRYSLCGARVGCLITWNNEVMTSALNFASTRVSAPSIEQQATATMLKTISDQYLVEVTQEYKERRDVLAEQLSQIDGVEFAIPDGGFYILAKLPVENAQDFAQFMLRDFSLNGETVCVSPASGFFLNSPASANYVRLAFVVSKHDLIRAAKIIENALVIYKTKC
jgi:aspartate aminotransferase